MAWAAGMPVAAAVARVQSGVGSLRAVPFSSMTPMPVTPVCGHPRYHPLSPLSRVSGSGQVDLSTCWHCAQHAARTVFFHNKTPPLDADNPGDWVLATWQGLSSHGWGAAGLRSSDRAGEVHSKSFQWTAFGRQSLSGIQPIY